MKHPFWLLWTIALLLSMGQARAQQSASAERVYVVVDQMPRFRNTDSSAAAMLSYLGRNTRYPVDALRDKATGRVFVSFVVNKEGNVEQAKVLKKAHWALDKEALRVVSEMPRWEVPGRQQGQPASVAFTVPVAFNMRMATPTEAAALVDRRQAAVQKQVDDAQAQLATGSSPGTDAGPLFTADPLGAANYISRHVQYPLDARRAKQQGTVLVAFVVNADGTVADVRVTKSVFPSLDAEALRVVTGMPRWQPATHGGQPVALPLSDIPVNFRLQ